MIRWHSLAALTLACVASFSSACSSSSSATPTKFACAAYGSMADQACVSCVSSHCNTQAIAELGPGYASGDYSGGSCAAFFSCLAKCACNDLTCLQTCETSETTECKNAEMAASSCGDANCQSQCQTTISTGDDGGGLTGSGDGGAGSNGICFVQSGSSCTTADLVGCCKDSGAETCFYSPMFTVSTATQGCSAAGGTWSTTQ